MLREMRIKYLSYVWDGGMVGFVGGVEGVSLSANVELCLFCVADLIASGNALMMFDRAHRMPVATNATVMGVLGSNSAAG